MPRRRSISRGESGREAFGWSYEASAHWRYGLVVAAVLVAGVLAGGCVPLKVAQRPSGPVPVEVRVDDAAYWLEEWQRALSMTPEAYKDQLAQREKDYAQRPDARNALRLALLLAEGKPSGRNPSRALELLQSIEGTAVDDSSKALAGLLRQVINEQRAAADAGEKDHKDLKAAKQRVEELERQLQGLTSIEQNIQDRTKK